MNYILVPSYYCFIFIYLVSFIVVIRREDWFLVWMGLEINIISFLILIYKRYRIIVGESCLRYFFIQSIGSSLFIRFFFIKKFFLGGMLSVILRLKIGAGPFFFWFPSLCLGLDWFSCYFLILFQKILPLMLIFLLVHWILWIIVFVSLIIGVLGSFNQRNLKSLLAYSSIHHLGWIIIVGILKNIRWLLYLFIYGIVLLRVIVLLFKDEVIDLRYFYTSKYKLIYLIRIMRIGGVPPLLGFFLKWIALVRIIELGMIYLFILVVVSVIILYIYIRIVYDVFIKRRVDLIDNWLSINYIGNIEIIRVVGIIIGVILLFLLM